MTARQALRGTAGTPRGTGGLCGSQRCLPPGPGLQHRCPAAVQGELEPLLPGLPHASGRRLARDHPDGLGWLLRQHGSGLRGDLLGRRGAEAGGQAGPLPNLGAPAAALGGAHGGPRVGGAGRGGLRGLEQPWLRGDGPEAL